MLTEQAALHIGREHHVGIGRMGIAKQLKDEVDDCPPILVLTGRPDDAWLANWSRAEAAVPHPIDPIRLTDAVVGLLTRT